MKTVGFFREMSLYADDGPIDNHIVDHVNYDKTQVVRYLQHFDAIATCPRKAIDCKTNEEIQSSFRVITDGEYEWCDFLPYHIIKYNINLPEEFIKKTAIL